MKSTAYAISPATRSAPPCWGSAVAKPGYRESAGPLYECAGGDRPTIASTDAPCSAVGDIHRRREFDSYLMLPRNPNMVIVDTQIVAGAPARLLAAGIGDALATVRSPRLLP